MRGVVLCLASLLVLVPNRPHAQKPIHSRGDETGRGAICTFLLDGGCAASPGGDFVQPSFSSYAQQSGQTWTNAHPWNWNSCGVDYACGYYTPTARLTDPSVSPPRGCTFNSAGGTSGGPIVTCAATQNLSIVGYDFSLHSCVPLDIKSGQTGMVTIKDDRFAEGANCKSNSPATIGSYLVFLENASVADLDFESNDVNGGKDTSLAGCILAWVSGRVTLRYNVVRFCDSQPFQDGNPAANSVSSQFNYVEGMVYASGLHGEWFIRSFSGGIQPVVQSSYDTVLQDADNKISGSTALIYETSGNACCAVRTAVLDHLVGIANLNRGQSTTSVAGEWGGASYANIIIYDNFIDDTGLLQDWYITSGACAHAASFHGNVRLTTGASIDAWSTNQGFGC